MYIYCLRHVYIWFVINSDTVYGECRILRFKIIVFRVRGPCNHFGGYRDFIHDILPPSSDGLRRETQNSPPERS